VRGVPFRPWAIVSSGLRWSAVVCGADDWVGVADFGTSKQASRQTFLELPNGIFSHDS
jgi:hypothetical protein